MGSAGGTGAAGDPPEDVRRPKWQVPEMKSAELSSSQPRFALDHHHLKRLPYYFPWRPPSPSVYNPPAPCAPALQPSGPQVSTSCATFDRPLARPTTLVRYLTPTYVSLTTHAIPADPVQMSLSLASLPEEILERILTLALEPSSPPPDVPPAILKAGFTRSHSAPFPVSAGRAPPSSSTRPSNFKAFSRTPVHRYTLLLTCTLFARIGTPLLYSAVHLKSRPSCALLGNTLRRRPDLARTVRALRLDGLWGEAALLLRALHVPEGRLARFDLCITADRDDTDGRGSDLEQFCDALGTLPALGTVHRLTIRKTADAYLTLTAPNAVLQCLSRVIPVWRSLVRRFRA